MGDSSATAVATEKGQRFSRERGFVTFVTCMSKQSGVIGPNREAGFGKAPIRTFVGFVSHDVVVPQTVPQLRRLQHPRDVRGGGEHIPHL